MNLGFKRVFRSRLIAASAALTLLSPGAPAVAQAAHLVTPAVGVHPHAVFAGRSAAGSAAITFGCQFNRPGRLQCYSPQQIRTAYGVQALLDKGDTGKGRTIVIVDAFSSPTIASDLALFNSAFGLNAPPAFNQIAPDGLTPFDPTDSNQVGWSAEISLDVQWAHAIAPDATIDLVLAKSNQDADILSATKYAVDRNLGDVISQSFGEAESCVDPALMAQEHRLFARATEKGITLVASSGDQGAAQPNCDGSNYILSASSPASDPLVTAVGGTNLLAGPVGCSSTAPGITPIPCPDPLNVAPGTYISEHAWNNATPAGGGDPAHGFSGGGFSTIYSRPGYQSGVPGIPRVSRGVPDVAYDAGLEGGVLVFWGVPFGPGAAFIFGGTSSGSPQWSGLVALADQANHERVGFINPALYALSRRTSTYNALFHDITTGNNNFFFADGSDLAGYNAGTGWDPVTGLGTPKAARVVGSLADH